MFKTIFIAGLLGLAVMLLLLLVVMEQPGTPPPRPEGANEAARDRGHGPGGPPELGLPPSSVIASRIFAGPNQYPPKEFAAYSIVAFPSRPSLHDRDRYLTICHAYVATLPHASELELPRLSKW